MNKIKRKFSTSVQIFAELFMKFDLIEIRYAGKTRLRNEWVNKNICKKLCS